MRSRDEAAVQQPSAALLEEKHLFRTRNHGSETQLGRQFAALGRSLGRSPRLAA
jgi:hypothetical protein